MASANTTFDITSSHGRREELADFLTIMSPMDTPLLSLLEHVPVHNTFSEWLVDDIVEPTAATTGAPGVEGLPPDDATTPNAFGPSETRFRMGNYTSLIKNFVEVSDTERLMNMAASGDDFPYKLWKELKRIGKQLDYDMHWQVDAAGNASTTARTTSGLVNTMILTAKAAAGFSTGNGSRFITAAGEQPAVSTVLAGVTYAQSNVFGSTWDFASASDKMTVANFTSMIQKQWDHGMTIKGSTLLAGAAIRRLVSQFAILGPKEYGTPSNTAAAQGLLNERNVSARSRFLSDTIDFFDTDLGEVAFNLDRRFQGSSAITVGGSSVTPDQSWVLLEPRMWQIGVLNPLSFTPLAKVTDSTRGMLVVEAMLKFLNPVGAIGGSGWAA